MEKNILAACLLLTITSCQAQPKIDELDSFEKISWRDIEGNAINMIGHDWMLIAAGKPGDYNMMTASWGSMGWLWQKPVITTFVRPQRHTHNFTEREDYFTVTFYEEKDKDILKKLGTVSGRNFDKMGYEKLTPVLTEKASVAFEEAVIVLECKKLYASKLKESDFVLEEVADSMYPDKDFHTMYVGEIVNVWRKKNE